MSEMLNRVAAFGGDNGACGAADPKETPASACGSACGAADPDKKYYNFTQLPKSRRIV